MTRSFLRSALTLAWVTAPFLFAQEGSAQARVVRLAANPSTVTVQVGMSVPLEIEALDEAGNVVSADVRVGGARRALRYAQGQVTGRQAGDWELVATVVQAPTATGEPATLRIPVTVVWPPVDRVEVEAAPGALYAGTALPHSATVWYDGDIENASPVVEWTSSDPAVATVDRFGTVRASGTGSVTIEALSEGVAGGVRYQVRPFPGQSLAIDGGSDQARTGDVLTFDAIVRGAGGASVDDVPVRWSLGFQPDDSIHAPGASGILEDGKFVGEVPGLYTIVANAGDLHAEHVVDVRPREAASEVTVVGQGGVSNVHTSDLWVFEGLDGRDHAVTGTWGGDGWAYFWDVTNPASPVRTDSLQVDARTVNDVKVSPSGRYAALSREGASNRRNGVVIMDLADPNHPTIASVFDDGLTGGVHNMFATEEYLFALSGGDKYVILDVRDLTNPTYVSEYNHPNSRIHDVWVHDGIAYSSEWENGVVVVDVGNGRWGGTIEEPAFVTNVPYPVGRTHAAFPYYQESTGKFYLFLGDEIMNREGAAWSGAGLGRIPQQGGTPSVTSGYVHIIDFTDPENPQDVARYEASEFGTHNMWVEDDVLYQAYYEGGMRVVDVSGELKGNLATQGREMAVYKSFSPNGYVANAPMVWGGQPFKGHVFFSDFNSGLWAVKVAPKGRPVS